MKYCIVGAGGCGGTLAGYLSAGGKDVTLIARGKHLQAILENGLTLETIDHGTFTQKVCAVEMEAYQEKPDVVLVCVKAYSLPEILPFLKRICGEHTIVIPILNGYGIGEALQKEIPDVLVLDGCMYVAAHRSAPGVITLNGSILRVIFGVRDPETVTNETARRIFQTARDLQECRIDGSVTNAIQREILQKFSLVSPMAACGLYFDCPVGTMQEAGEPRLFFEDLVKEIDQLAAALEVPFLIDAVKTNLDILDGMNPQAYASLQRDVMEGKPSEADTLLLKPLQLGKTLGVEMPSYQKVVEKLGAQGLIQ